MDLTGAGEGVGAACPCYLFPPFCHLRLCACGLSILSLRCLGGAVSVGLGIRRQGRRVCGCCSELGFEFTGFGGAECVPGTDDVGAVDVSVGIEGLEEVEHLGCVAAAAEDDEDVSGASTGVDA